MSGEPPADPKPRPGQSCPAVELTFPSCPEYLSLLREVVEWFAARRGFSDTDCGRIVLSVVEATTNIIRHAYDGDSNQKITLRMRELEEGLELEFLDRGWNVSPGGLEGKPREDLEPGGLGVRMIKTCMDELHYEVRPGGGARLVLRKRRDPGRGEKESGEHEKPAERP